MFIPKPTSADLQSALNLSAEPEYIATGGFKVVFKSDCLGASAEALKLVFLPQAATEEEIPFREQLVARANREIAALEELSHPAIVKLGSLAPVEITIGGHDYLAYSEEFLPGESLTAAMGGIDDVPLEDLQAVFSTLIALIADLNEHGYLHRDIKPDNVIQTMDPDRRYVVLDMGIAYKMQGTELTRGGAPGTLSYMAPELLDMDYKDSMDFRCDLYSAALTVYAMAVGGNPFRPGPQRQDVTEYYVRSKTAEPLFSLRPDLPEAFCKIIDRCIRKKPALRYARLELLQKDLTKVLS